MGVRAPARSGEEPRRARAAARGSQWRRGASAGGGRALVVANRYHKGHAAGDRLHQRAPRLPQERVPVRVSNVPEVRHEPRPARARRVRRRTKTPPQRMKRRRRGRRGRAAPPRLDVLEHGGGHGLGHAAGDVLPREVRGRRHPRVSERNDAYGLILAHPRCRLRAHAVRRRAAEARDRGAGLRAPPRTNRTRLPSPPYKPDAPPLPPVQTGPGRSARRT